MSYQEAISQFRDGLFDLISEAAGHNRIYPARTNFVKPKQNFITYRIGNINPLEGAGYSYDPDTGVQKSYLNYEVIVNIVAVNPDPYGMPSNTQAVCGRLRQSLSKKELVYKHLTLNNIGFLRASTISDSSSIDDGAHWEERANFIAYFHVIIEKEDGGGSDGYIETIKGTQHVTADGRTKSRKFSVGDIITGDAVISESPDTFVANGTFTDINVYGDLTVSETTSDTFAANGTFIDINVYGDLIVSETTPDTFAANGEFNYLDWDFVLNSPNLMGYYTIDDRSAPLVTDMSGNGRDLTATGALEVVSGVSGDAYKLTGVTSQYLRRTSYRDLSRNNTAISMWVPDNARGFILSTERTGNFLDGSTYIKVESNGSVAVRVVYDGLEYTEASTSPLLTGTGDPIHIMVNFNEDTRTREIWINGTLRGSGTAAPLPSGFTWESASNFDFGRWRNSSWGTLSATGWVDQIRVYDRVLTSNEIKSLHWAQ